MPESNSKNEQFGFLVASKGGGERFHAVVPLQGRPEEPKTPEPQKASEPLKPIAFERWKDFVDSNTDVLKLREVLDRIRTLADKKLQEVQADGSLVFDADSLENLVDKAVRDEADFLSKMEHVCLLQELDFIKSLDEDALEILKKNKEYLGVIKTEADTKANTVKKYVFEKWKEAVGIYSEMNAVRGLSSDIKISDTTPQLQAIEAVVARLKDHSGKARREEYQAHIDALLLPFVRMWGLQDRLKEIWVKWIGTHTAANPRGVGDRVALDKLVDVYSDWIESDFGTSEKQLESVESVVPVLERFISSLNKITEPQVLAFNSKYLHPFDEIKDKIRQRIKAKAEGKTIEQARKQEFDQIRLLLLKAIESFEVNKTGGDLLTNKLPSILDEGFGYLAKLENMVKVDVSLNPDFLSTKEFVLAKLDLHSTWMAMRPAVEEEPRDISRLPQRSAFDLTTVETDYLINKCKFINPDSQCRNERKRVLGLDGKYHEVIVRLTPVAMVMNLIDDIFDGRFFVPVSESGGEERFVTGKNFHKNEDGVIRAIKRESRRLSGDGSEFSDDAIRTGMRLHTIWVLGQSHESSSQNPATGDQFTKAYLWERYCKLYSTAGKDTFLPGLPYSVFGVDYRGSDPEVLKTLDAKRHVSEKMFSKLSLQQKKKYGWMLQPLFSMLPYKSSHVENNPSFDPTKAVSKENSPKITIPAHYGYVINPLMAYLSVGRFPVEQGRSMGKTMSFDFVREEGTEKRVYNMLPFIEKPAGSLFAGVKPPDAKVLSQYYPDLKGTAYPLFNDILMGDPAEIYNTLNTPNKLGGFVKKISDGWSFIRNTRDHDSARVKEDQKKFRIILAKEAAAWALTSNTHTVEDVEGMLNKLQQKQVGMDEEFLNHEDADVILKVVVDYWHELQQEFGQSVVKIVEHSK